LIMSDKERLKIAVLVRRFVSTGGVERYSVEVTQRLAPQHEVHVFAQEWSFQGKTNITFHKIPRWPNKPSWLNQIVFSWFSRKAAGSGFDIVHSHEKVVDFDVMTIHSPCFRSYISQEKSPLKKMLIRASVPFSPRKLGWLWLEKKQFTFDRNKIFIAVSEKVKKDVQANYEIPDERFCIAYPGVDVKMKKAVDAGADRNRLRSELGLPQDELIVLFVGTEFKRKGLDALLRGLALMRQPGMRLVVAGGGGGRMKQYCNLARKLGLGEQVIFLGLVEKVEDLYALSDIYVLPTLSDPYGMAPMEAMLCGVPVALSSSQYCGAAEHVGNREALIIENPRNPKEISEVILKLKSKSLRAEMSRKGRTLAEELTWEKTTSATLSAYAEALRRKHSKEGT
jgi:glycosyltransferase involved in cell wall biosynthesis